MPADLHRTDTRGQEAGLFRCPLCSGPMRFAEKSLVCTSNHCFDIARSGYVNFLTRPHRTKYSKELFTARRSLLEQGFFQPLLAALCARMQQKAKDSGPGSIFCRILDAGCGEGSNLAGLLRLLKESTAAETVGVGLDIAKEGVNLAAKKYPEAIWCVGDLAHTPLAPGSFDYILNILSPANYGEFGRLLAPDGTVIKVIPGEGYLRELRALLYMGKKQQDYSDSAAEKCFLDSMVLLDSERIQYSVVVEGKSVSDLAQMTPLFWGAGEDDARKVLDMNSLKVTVDLIVLFGRRRKKE